MRVLCGDLSGDGVIGLQLQPSLSLLDASQATLRETPAFVLQAAGVSVRSGWPCA